MSTDRELLELAAKAAGYTIFRVHEDGRFVVWDGERSHWDWNPLANDGDALRLAVKLNLEVVQFTTTVRVGGLEMGSDDCHEEKGSDPYAATRRAIVRAAAEIGRTMP